LTIAAVGTVAFAALLAASAIVLPLFGLARRIGRPDLALPWLRSAAAVPAMALMTPEFNQVYGSLAGARGCTWAFAADTYMTSANWCRCGEQ
jgi:hypothetical protein